jgi:hypothetical protein
MRASRRIELYIKPPEKKIGVTDLKLSKLIDPATGRRSGIEVIKPGLLVFRDYFFGLVSFRCMSDPVMERLQSAWESPCGDVGRDELVYGNDSTEKVPRLK